MEPDLSNTGKVKVSMVNYPEGLIESLLDTITGNHTSPEAGQLFYLQ